MNTRPGEPFTCRRGDRIAQLVIQRFETASFVEVDDLPESERGPGATVRPEGSPHRHPDEVGGGDA